MICFKGEMIIVFGLEGKCLLSFNPHDSSLWNHLKFDVHVTCLKDNYIRERLDTFSVVMEKDSAHKSVFRDFQPS